MMTGRERYFAVLEGQQPDFVPRIPILMQFAAEFIGSNYAEFASNHEVLVRSNLACAEAFDFDQVSCISDPYRETQGFGGVVEYVTDGVPRCTHPLAEDRSLDRLARPDPHLSERMRDRVDACRLYRQLASDRYSILGWVEGPAAEAADLRDTINFLYDLMDDPVYAAELMDRCLEVAIAFAKAQLQAGADTIGIGDAIVSQLSPDLYESLVQPREKKLVRAIQAAGGRVRLHICGDISHLLPGIADLGVDILDVDHMVSLSAVRAAVGPRVVIAGNLDPAEAILRGNPAAIRIGIQSCRDEAGLPFMVCAGCEIPPRTPIENLKALCEPLAWR
ncbi:MAG: uroporphyrinogen decarboxylase family protein [Kiritimatiellae bacterium]|nr:uroporphyrinogen decarboxylase family protein [Kiritimatiellia bacterium]